MVTSYGYLFVIETKTRTKAKKILEDLYGSDSLTIIRSLYKNKLSNKSLENMHFHELVSFLKMVPILEETFGESFIRDLTQLSPIRNKIAHCLYIDEKEFAFLYRTYTYYLK